MTPRVRSEVRVAAVAGPVVVAAATGLLRELLATTSAALLLVLVVVAVGVAGDRVAGVLAALSAAAAFDYFLAVPYYQFAILSRDDVETAVLLLAIGIAVTEISLWGRRQQSQSGRREGYLTGVAHAARMAADGSTPEDLIATVGRMITDVLDLDDTRYEPPTAQQPRRTDRPVLDADGTLSWRGHTIDVARDGVPTMDTTELRAGRDGEGGRFLLTAASRVRRPSHEQLLVAITLAEQVTVAPGGSEHGVDLGAVESQRGDGEAELVLVQGGGSAPAAPAGGVQHGAPFELGAAVGRAPRLDTGPGDRGLAAPARDPLDQPPGARADGDDHHQADQRVQQPGDEADSEPGQHEHPDDLRNAQQDPRH
jgi:hypothetical protein